MKNKINKYVPYFLISFFFVFSIIINFEIQGITCNDEVQLRLNGQKGILYFLKKQILDEDINQGRILGILGNVKFISFISDNIYISRTIQIMFLLISFGLFAWLVYRIYGSKRRAILSFVLALAYLPITFEHAVPNAFVIVVCQPLICLLMSLICFIKGQEEKNVRYDVFSCLLFFWGCCLYEFVITYILIFPVLCMILYKDISIKPKVVLKAIRDSLWQIITAIIYLILYLLQGIIFKTSYSGTMIKLDEPSKIINVLKIECLSAIPGYYLVNDKYEYLHNIYKLKDMKITYIFILAIFVISFSFILIYALQREKSKNNWMKFLIGVITLFLYTIIPTLPNSITSLYQDNVSENYFTSIPVSLFLYLAMIFFLIIIIDCILNKFKYSIYPIIICLSILGFCIQYTNRGIAEEQFSNYERFVSIENFLKTDFWKNQRNLVIEAPSLFEIRNNLAIESEHWNSYSSLFCDNVIFSTQSNVTDGYIQMQEDNSFYISIDNEYYATTKVLSGLIILQDKEHQQRVVSIGDLVLQSNGYNFYKIDSGENK